MTLYINNVRKFVDRNGRFCQTETIMQPDPLSEREATILNAAFHAFSAFGFRRTTMDDIAQEARLSRTVLYQTYRNKEEIFRALSQAYYDQAVFDIQVAFSQPDMTLETALMACFVAKDSKFVEVVLTSPYGHELLDAESGVSQDLAVAGEAQMTAVLAEWLALQEVPEAIGPAPALAQTVMAALKGLRSTARTIEDLRSGESRLAALIARALR